jgi:hypothetical protein
MYWRILHDGLVGEGSIVVMLTINSKSTENVVYRNEHYQAREKGAAEQHALTGGMEQDSRNVNSPA